MSPARKPVYNLELLNQKPVEPKEKTIKKTIKKTSEKIVELLSDNRELTLSELSEDAGISIIGIRLNLNKLIKQGRIRRIGPDKGGHWEVLKYYVSRIRPSSAFRAGMQCGKRNRISIRVSDSLFPA